MLRILSLIFILLPAFLFGQKCTVTYRIKNNHSVSSITFTGEHGNVLFTDSQGKTEGTFSVDGLTQPVIANVFLNGQTAYYNRFYLHDGMVEMTIDSLIEKIKFVKDPLNDHEQELMKYNLPIVKMKNRIQRRFPLLDTAGSEYHKALLKIRKLEDSLMSLKYMSCIKHINSFATLDFIADALSGSGHYDKKQITLLFKVLAANVQNYPLYAVLKDAIENNPVSYKTGDKIGPHILQDINGRTVSVQNLVKKDFLLINFWSSGNEASTSAHMELINMLNDYRDYLDVIGISADKSKETVKATINREKLPFRNFCDYNGYMSQMFRFFGIDEVPNDVLINKAGTILKMGFGPYSARAIIEDAIMKKEKDLKKTKFDTLHISFTMKSSELSRDNKDKIDSLTTFLASIPLFRLDIYGHQDYESGNEGKAGLSEERANAVRDYLLPWGVDTRQIRKCIGEGNVNSNYRRVIQGGIAKNRRVDIVIERAASKLLEKPQKTYNTFHNPCGMMGDDNYVYNLNPGDTVFMCYTAFDNGGVTMSSAMMFELDCIATVMIQNKTIKIQISGSSTPGNDAAFDAGGKAFAPGELWKLRSNAISDFLKGKGVTDDRFNFIEEPRNGKVIKNPCTGVYVDLDNFPFIRLLEKENPRQEGAKPKRRK